MTLLKPIYVSQPFLPPLEEFNVYLEKIWESKWLTNRGDFHQKFEKELAEYLGVPYVSLLTNGMLALMVAIQALELKGEVITTPYSFVATTHSIWMNGLKPVFVDLKPGSFNIDPEKIEKAITSETSLILPVHVYGIPCDYEEIGEIAKAGNIKVLYDAAHAFGVTKNGNSILNLGDLSILSFHATKVFTTIEGGAIISHDSATKKKIDDLINFGIQNEIAVSGPGLNGKMNELQAAFGLIQLKHFDDIIGYREKIYNNYLEKLNGINGIKLFKDFQDFNWNFSYFPILVEDNFWISRDGLYEYLKEKNIFSRRYFYPLLSTFKPYNELESSVESNLPNAKYISDRILCLPIHTGVTLSDVEIISGLIKKMS